MKAVARHIIPILAFTFIHFSATAQTHGIRFFTENDYLSPFSKNEDDNYTGGVKLEFVFSKPGIFSLPFLLKNKLPREVNYQSIAFSGTAFTPRNLDSFNIVKDDRPYSSLLAFSFGSQYSSLKDSNVKFGYELLAGKMGDPAAGNIQGKIHRHEILKFISTNRPDPQGWHNQVANGGAFVVNININHERVLRKSKKENEEKHYLPFRLTLRHTLNAGNYLINSAHGLRVNLFNKQYDFNRELAPPVIIKRGQKLTPIEKPRAFSFTFYAEPRVKINVHNAGLTGKLLSRKSAHTIFTTNYPGGLTPVLFEYETGFLVRYYILQAGFSLQGRSKEFSSQNKPMHHWCGIYLAIVCYR